MTSIDVLPDDVLLVIFYFCVAPVRNEDTIRDIESWQSLAHVCGRWRTLVFGSPRRLNLRLVCTPRRPKRQSLDIWPTFRILIQGTISSTLTDNIVVALGHSDRVYRVNLEVISGLQWDKTLATMQVPFPALTELLLWCDDETAPVIPDTFLGRSAPHLRYLQLDRIPFPGIPKLLLSATHLIHLHLHGIPHSGYFSPEAMITSLSSLTHLGALSIEFLSPRSLPDSDRLPPPMRRSILLNLTGFWFEGTSEYLDNLVARFDAPRLVNLFITFFHQRDFDTPHLVQFISRTPSFEEPNGAEVNFDYKATDVRLLSSTSDDYGKLCVKLSCEEAPQQVSSMAQVCAKCLPPLPTVENLQVFPNFTTDPFTDLHWSEEDVGYDEWLEFLRPFHAVKSIYLSEEFQPGIASALQQLVGGRTTEVLPSLQNIFLGDFRPFGPFQKDIEEFVNARQLSGHSITVLPLCDVVGW